MRLREVFINLKNNHSGLKVSLYKGLRGLLGLLGLVVGLLDASGI
jgi:hypothetical protein